MDLLVVTWNYPPRRGGIENLLANLCRGLREKHRVFVVTRCGGVINADDRDTFRAPLGGLIPFVCYALWRGAALLARNPQIGIVLGGSALVTPLVLLLARLFRRRAMVLTHGLDVIHQNFLYQLLCVRWLKFCKHVIANSRYTAALTESQGVARERLTVIPPGVQCERFAGVTDVMAAKRRWNLEGKKVILFVGRFARRKGVKEFIERSLPSIVKAVPQACFVLVGGNATESLTERGDVAGEIGRAVRAADLDDRIVWLGAAEDADLANVYECCDVVVLPVIEMNSDVEGFGMTALEAAAAGKPVIATRVGGLPEAVADGQTGMVIEPGDYSGMSDAVTQLFDDESLRRKLGEAGRARAMTEFAWERIVERYAAVLEATVHPGADGGAS